MKPQVLIRQEAGRREFGDANGSHPLNAQGERSMTRYDWERTPLLKASSSAAVPTPCRSGLAGSHAGIRSNASFLRDQDRTDEINRPDHTAA